MIIMYDFLLTKIGGKYSKKIDKTGFILAIRAKLKLRSLLEVIL